MGEPLEEALAVPECMRLLETTAIGRLGFTEGALPAVQPVTYRLADGTLRIPAVPGSPVTRAIHDGIVVLAVDSFRTGASDGWAVTVVGPIRLVDDATLKLEPVLVSGWRRAAVDPGPAA